jgi:hypothetical protein
MDDRELLELAAKAAGLRRSTDMSEPEPGLWVGEDGVLFEILPAEGWKFWNPLVSDEDALRLAVKLELIEGLAIDFRQGEMDGPDPYAATRRAIVRAAAEIGKDMK